MSDGQRDEWWGVGVGCWGGVLGWRVGCGCEVVVGVMDEVIIVSGGGEVGQVVEVVVIVI